MKPTRRELVAPFLCGAAGVFVGAMLARLPANQATAADDGLPKPEPILVSEVTITSGKFGGPSVTIKPDGITLWSGKGVHMTRLMPDSLELGDPEGNRKIILNTEWKRGGGVVLQKDGKTRASLFLSGNGAGTLRLESAPRVDVVADLKEVDGAGKLEIMNNRGDVVVSAP